MSAFEDFNKYAMYKEAAGFKDFLFRMLRRPKGPAETAPAPATPAPVEPAPELPFGRNNTKDLPSEAIRPVVPESKKRHPFKFSPYGRTNKEHVIPNEGKTKPVEPAKIPSKDSTKPELAVPLTGAAAATGAGSALLMHIRPAIGDTGKASRAGGRGAAAAGTENAAAGTPAPAVSVPIKAPDNTQEMLERARESMKRRRASDDDYDASRDPFAPIGAGKGQWIGGPYQHANELYRRNETTGNMDLAKVRDPKSGTWSDATDADKNAVNLLRNNPGVVGKDID